MNKNLGLIVIGLGMGVPRNEPGKPRHHQLTSTALSVLCKPPSFSLVISAPLLFSFLFMYVFLVATFNGNRIFKTVVLNLAVFTRTISSFIACLRGDCLHSRQSTVPLPIHTRNNSGHSDSPEPLQ